MDDGLPTFLVLNRWDGEWADYHRFVAPHRCRIACVTLPSGRPVLSRSDTCVVAESLDFDTVLPIARNLAGTGGFAGVAGISEYDLETAARLREWFGVPGHQPDLVRRFRDKVVMKSAVGSAGLRVPRHLTLRPGITATEIAARVGLPAILKPRSGAASEGVLRVDSLGDLVIALATIDPTGYQSEEFLDGEILHVDGIRRAGGFHAVSVSAYVNTCLDFAQGSRLGSAMLDDSVRRAEILHFTGACLDALRLEDGPFHLELIDTGELHFLEVGLRPGGGDICALHKELFGIDLVAEAVRATLGLPPLVPPEDVAPTHGAGWVLVPEPRPYPSRLIRRSTLTGVVSGVYREILPEVGHVFDGTGGYTEIGGRFLLRGADEAAVRRAVGEVFDRYELVVEPAPVADRVAV